MMILKQTYHFSSLKLFTPQSNVENEYKNGFPVRSLSVIFGFSSRIPPSISKLSRIPPVNSSKFPSRRSVFIPHLSNLCSASYVYFLWARHAIFLSHERQLKPREHSLSFIRSREHFILFTANKKVVYRRGFKQVILTASRTRWKDTPVVWCFVIISQVSSRLSAGFRHFSVSAARPCTGNDSFRWYAVGLLCRLYASFICSSCLSAKQLEMTFRRQLATLCQYSKDVILWAFELFYMHMLIWQSSFTYSVLQSQTSRRCV